MVHIACISIGYLLIISVWLVGRRLKKYRAYYLLPLYLCTQALIVWMGYNASAPPEEKAVDVLTRTYDGAEQGGLEERSMMLAYVGLFMDVMFYVAFLSPSLSFTLVYIVINAAAVTTLALYSPGAGSENFAHLMAFTAIVSLYAIFICHLLQ